MTEAPINKNIKTSGGKISFPLIFLVLIIIMTVWIYWYNSYIESENDNLEADKIAPTVAKINDIKKDNNIKVYSLIQDNKKILNKLESFSDITNIIKWISYIENNYDLNLKWFNYSNWVVSTKAYTDPNRVSNWYRATSYFISKYRKDKKAIFKLPYISKFSWSKNIAFNLKLEVKDNLINNKK